MQQTKSSKKLHSQLAELPTKQFFTIGEVSHLCNVKPHVLRYWEQEFPQLSPTKRRGNRRYYEREEVLLIRDIRHLLYEQGFTIGGARKQLTITSKNQAIATQDQQAAMLAALQEVLDILEN